MSTNHQAEVVPTHSTDTEVNRTGSWVFILASENIGVHRGVARKEICTLTDSKKLGENRGTFFLPQSFK